jgi:hypothetical protein
MFGAPTKSKMAKDMKEAFDELFTQMPFMPMSIWSDRGNEFTSKQMREYYEQKGVDKHEAKTSKIKAAVAERAIRTLKGRLYKYFSENNTTDWITPLPKFLYAINNSVSRSIGVKPSSINADNARELWERIYGDAIKSARPRLNPGDNVRITKPKQIFDKGYFPSRSDHIYTIDETVGLNPEHYKLKKDSGEKVDERFYFPELVKTKKDEQTSYRIEKKIKERTRKGVKEILVKFLDYPGEFWVKQSDVVI